MRTSLSTWRSPPHQVALNEPGKLGTIFSSSWINTKSFVGIQNATSYGAGIQTRLTQRDRLLRPHPSPPVAKGPSPLSWTRLDQVTSLIMLCPLTGFTLTHPSQFVKLYQRVFVNQRQINTVPTFQIGWNTAPPNILTLLALQFAIS